jgi:hypothetical protein
MALNNTAYSFYFDFLKANKEKLFVCATKTIKDVKNIRKDNDKKSFWDNHGEIDLSSDFFEKGERTVYWQDNEERFLRFHYCQCPCGKLGDWRDPPRKRPFGQPETFGISNSHLISCLSLAKKVNEVDQSQNATKSLVEYHLCRKKPNKEIVSLYGHLGKVTSIRKIKANNDKIKCLDSEFLLSSEVVHSPSEFPSLPGIYFIRYFNCGQWQPLYIGKSINLRSRWKCHHRENEVNFLLSLGIGVEFRYIAETPFLKFSESLESIESKLIEQINPALNRKAILSLSNNC